MNLLQQLLQRPAPERTGTRSEEELATMRNHGLPPGAPNPLAQAPTMGSGMVVQDPLDAIRQDLMAIQAEAQGSLGNQAMSNYARYGDGGREIRMQDVQTPVPDRTVLDWTLRQYGQHLPAYGLGPQAPTPQSMERPNPTLPGHRVNPVPPPAMIGVDFNMPPVPPTPQAQPQVQAPAPPQGPPVGVIGTPNGPIIIGGGSDAGRPFGPLSPEELPNPTPSHSGLTNVQDRNINAGFPSQFTPTPPSAATLQLPEFTGSLPPPPAPPPVAPVAPRTTIGGHWADAFRPPAPAQPAARPRPAPMSDDNLITEELNRRELERFIRDEPISIAPPAPNAPSSGVPRATPTPPPAPPVPETAKPSGQGIPGPKMGQAVPEHLKDALLQEALRLTRAKKGVA